MSKKKLTRWQYIRQKFPKRMQKKLVMLFMAIVLAFVFLVGKITHINATNGEKYTKIVLDQQQYYSLNPDVKGADMNPLFHYEKYGRKEKRRVHSSD